MTAHPLPVQAPLAVAPLRRFLLAHAVPGLERVEPGTGRLTRAVRLPAGGAVTVTVDLGAPGVTPDDLPADTSPVRLTAPASALPVVTPAVRRWLDLDLDPAQPDTALAADPTMAPLVHARPGLRVPGSLDGFETLVLAVLGQQVSLAAARTLAGRLVAAFGLLHDDGLRLFPEPATLAAAGPDAVRVAIGTTATRAATIHGVAVAAAEGLDLTTTAAPDRLRRDLVALPGIGPWTAEIVAMRVLRDTDAFLPTDLVLRRALGGASAREAVARAEAWRPWRAYALMHLWTREVFA